MDEGRRMAPAPYWTSADGRHVLYQGDCRDVLPALRGLDVLLTDPPYGVHLGTRGDVGKARPRNLAKRAYASYEDTPENVERLVIPVLAAALPRVQRGLVFCLGTDIPRMPPFQTLGGVFLPAGCGRTTWGFQNFAHFLLYGANPHHPRQSYPIGFASTAAAEPSLHPCPKPLGWMVWCVHLVSLPGETVLDPFCGSATTGVACIQTGRRFIGIETDATYCDLAVERLEWALSQELFEPSDVVQLALF